MKKEALRVLNLEKKEEKMKKVILTLALVLMTVLAAGTAQAVESYAFSWDYIFNSLVIVTSNSGGTTGASGTVATDGATSSATINGSGSANASIPGVGPTPPILTELGTPSQTGGAGNFSQVGLQSTTYSIGQAQVQSVQTAVNAGPPFIDAINKAESNAIAPPSPTSATAQGKNDSSSAIIFDIALTTGGTVQFEGNAAPFLNVFLSPDASVGSSAEADLHVDIVIKDSAGNVVFNWSPNGTGAGAVGGTVLNDPFSLNTTLSQLSAGSSTYNPFGLVSGDFSGASVPTAHSGFYSAVTSSLAAGDYTLSLSMVENTSVIAVPETGTIFLLGAGLIGMAIFLRRKWCC